MATYDPLQDALKPPATQTQGIVNAAMQTPATAAPTATAAPATTGIVGAQSQQLQAPTTWNVSDDQTVEGRINRIIQAGSPLQEQAKNDSLQAANARGLSNTSMAVTAGQDALYRNVLPIAQADAATAAKAAGYNADQNNQWSVKNTDAENQFKLADKQNTAQANLTDKQALWQKDIALMNRETQTQLANLDAANKAQADAITADHQNVLQTNQQANSSMQQAVSAVSAIQNNNQMDAGTKTAAVASIWRDLQTQLRVLGSVAGLNLTSQLNFANYPGFDANGNYIGFDTANGVPGGLVNGGTSGGVPVAGVATAAAPAVNPGALDPNSFPTMG